MAKTVLRSTPITLLESSEWKSWLNKQDLALQQWALTNKFIAKAGSFCLIPDNKNGLSKVLVGIRKPLDIWSLAALPELLPVGHYHLDATLDRKLADMVMLGWLMGSYRFARYKKQSNEFAILRPPAGCDMASVQALADAIFLARDLINTPANDLGPEELAVACKKVATKHKAEYNEIIGEDLLKKNFPAIYTVGMASSRAPRLIDIRWGNKKHPKVTLVGKGVCFDSGGLDIKTSAGMKLMKKDMGGAACLLALAQVIMQQKLPVRLRLLVPAVENAISGNAYRPSDVIATHKGLTVEVGNTDAEGRLILCDALALADKEKPDLLIDCATLTGAARTALGTDIPALFTQDDRLAKDLLDHSEAQNDPLWRLPLWPGYRDMLNSSIADINSAPDSGYAGAITAALFLKEFVTETKKWAHIDMMAWNLSKRPGRPVGGEAMAIRALYSFIKAHFAQN
jgi:leucyl aminopeptidase